LTPQPSRNPSFDKGEIMKTRILSLLTVFAVVFATVAVSNQSGDESKERLHRVAERYRAMTAYDLHGRMLMRIQSSYGTQNLEGRLRVAGVRPNLQFVEVTGHPMLGMQIVTTPESTWVFMALMDQYTAKPAVVTVDGGFMNGGLAAYLMLDERAAESRAIGKETVRTTTGAHECLVVAMAPDTVDMGDGTAVAQAETLWVDTDRYLVLRHTKAVTGGEETGGMGMATTMEYDDAGFENRPPDSLFVFTPPRGAKRVDEFKGPQSPDIVKPAPGPAAPFTLADLAGKQVSLAEHKGKVVMLDFWATWCGPCRIELPHVDKLSRDLADKGLVVLAITAESREQASAYLEKNKLGLRCLIDAGGKVNKSYGIQAIPTVVVIDRNGNVSDFLVGLQTEKNLLAAVKRAGIE
jgi:cytochrome c biogenesis protein CcmG/thiol:disulfide interchange protein DsbE